MERYDFINLVDGLKAHLNFWNKMANAIEYFGLNINTDNTEDYFWNTVWNTLNEHYPEDVVDICFNYMCDGYLKTKENGLINNANELYNYINEGRE